MVDLSSFIGPVFSALCAFAGSWLAFSTRLTRVETKMDMLAEDVRKHNGVVERMTVAENDIKHIESEIKHYHQ